MTENVRLSKCATLPNLYLQQTPSGEALKEAQEKAFTRFLP